MDKTAIKNFAIWARQKLIKDISYKAGLLGISDKGISEELPQSTDDLKFFDIGTKDYTEVSGKEIKQREALVEAIKSKERDVKNYSEAFEFIIEEVAYTWFNRLIAIRFMEVNGYLPSGIRVLSSENSAKNEPDFVTNPFDTELDLTSTEEDLVLELKDQNKSDELFRMLFIKQCNKLHEVLPHLFEEIDDYTELLLTISFVNKDGVVYKLVNDIDEDDFNVEKEGQVEIIGWMYQYYISEKRDEVINPLYGKTIKKQDIPAATQIFTTDWVVRYMVDNSLGRYWIERNRESKLANKLQFFVTPKDGRVKYIDEKINPVDLTFFDPCMGSGHILVYAFDVLMDIYRECGYLDRDAAVSIVENNLFGMDIDRRAYQLAYFAVMMKARSYNRRVLTKSISNNLSVVEESNSIDRSTYDGLTIGKEQNKIAEYLVNAYRDAKEIGTLQTIEKHDYKSFTEYLENLENNVNQLDIFSSSWLATIKPLMLQLAKQAVIMSGKYAVVCTNPPYLNKMEGKLKKFVVENYKAYSGDLFSVFMYRNFDYCKEDGYSAFMTSNVWMFIKTYEKLREYIVTNKSIVTLIQMAKGAFFKEATVDVCAFVLSNKSNNKGAYFRLEEFKGDMDVQKQKVLEALDNKECGYFYETEQSNFDRIPGSPIAYWVSEIIYLNFQNKTIGDVEPPRFGMSTSNNKRFVRIWHEVDFKKFAVPKMSIDKVEVSKKWFPYNNGGDFRRWYGNNFDVVNWENDGYEIKNFKRAAVRNKAFYYQSGITWTAISSSKISVRAFDYGFLFSSAGFCIFEQKFKNYILALMNNKVGEEFLKILSPTVNFNVGDIRRVPVKIDDEKKVYIDLVVNKCITISKNDWDSFETSWDFKVHPLVRGASVEDAFINWEKECEERFNTLKSNEEELNRIFIDIYGLQDELTPEVKDKDVTVNKADLQRDIKSLVSYAVGCMVGRYSIDMEGLAYAGGEWDDSKYSTFIPDADNCIPITDEEYFEDDIVGRFEKFLRVVYGDDTLEENLDFIAKALGNRGNTSREIIRKYLLNDFIKDHNRIYQKRPIYWMYDSGKQNGFKALVYMHRWNADTTGNMRVEYLHRMQKVYENEIERMQEIIDNSTNSREVSNATKRKEKLQKQLKETKDYDAKIAHLALSRICIDLDDGVKVNHEKVQTPDDGKVLEVLAKI